MATSTTKLRPLADQVLIRPAKPVEKTQGGIVLPTKAQQNTCRGEVLAVGPGKRGSLGMTDEVASPAVKAGDVVLYSAFTGQEIEADGEKLLLMSEEHLLAVCE